MSQRTYLDWNATAPVRPEAREAFLSALDRFGNPSSVHAEGRAARALLEESRAEVASFMGCFPEEVVFTSGGFEANNIALKSLAAAAPERTFAAARIEHGSISGYLDLLLEEGWIGENLDVSTDGFIDPDSLDDAVGFAAFQAMNQETGALQHVERFGERCKELSVDWHCDAVQLWGRLDFKVGDLGCVTAGLTGHKIGAPKGIGALYVKKGFPIVPLMVSGPQERGRRPGTENIPGAAALAAACRAALATPGGYAQDCLPLREKLIEEISSLYPDAVVNGPKTLFVPNTLSISFPGVDGAMLVTAMDLEGVAVSAGSACSSGASKPSPVLSAMGLPREVCTSALRISMGWLTTEEDIDRFLAALKTVLGRLPRGA